MGRLPIEFVSIVLCVELCPPKTYVQISTPISVNVTLFGSKGLYRCRQVKMSHWIRMASKLMPSFLYMKREIWTQGDKQKEGHVTTEAETGVVQLKARKSKDRQETTRSWERGIEQILPQSFLKESTRQPLFHGSHSHGPPCSLNSFLCG